jgi:hypothetical protein
VNPCDPDQQYGTNFTVPAQQFNVIKTVVSDSQGQPSVQWLYYGERANSAPDRLFSHNFQAWVPLDIQTDGSIAPMTFPPTFTLNLTNATL